MNAERILWSSCRLCFVKASSFSKKLPWKPDIPKHIVCNHYPTAVSEAVVPGWINKLVLKTGLCFPSFFFCLRQTKKTILMIAGSVCYKLKKEWCRREPTVKLLWNWKIWASWKYLLHSLKGERWKMKKWKVFCSFF